MKITMRDLEGAVSTLNRITGQAPEPYTKTDAGDYAANVGNYHLDGAYGGWQLCRMENDSGGMRDVLSSGHVPKRELYSLTWAFIKGIEAA